MRTRARDIYSCEVDVDRETSFAGFPVDVRRTADWLEQAGFDLVSFTPRHGMGFALLDYASADEAVRIVSDRDQWMLD